MHQASRAAILLALLAPSVRVLGQDPPPPTGGRPGGIHPPALPQEPRLSAEPFRVPGLGLSMRLPLGAIASIEPLADRTSAVIVDGASPPAWSVRAQPMRSSLPEPSPAAQIDHLVRAWTSEGRLFRVIEERLFEIDGHPAAEAYFSHPPEPAGDDPAAAGTAPATASGWIVVQVDELDFLVFVLHCLEDRLPDVRPRVQAAIATVRLQSMGEVNAARTEALVRAEEFVASITPETLRAACGRSEFLRLYRPHPAGEGDIEVGWMRIEVREAARGLLTPTRDPEKYTSTERESGLLVLVQGRAVADAQRRVFLDTDARFWLAWDLEEEEWSIRATHRQGEANRSEAETGVRSARTAHDPRGTLMVITRSMQGVTNDDLVWGVPDSYLSQALRWLLGRILPREDREPGTYAWYHYDTRLTALPMRVDRWEPAANGKWILRSQPRDNEPEIVTIYDTDGTVIRRITSEGVISEPIDPEALRRRWRALGLESQ